VSEHKETLAALERIATVLERLEAKLASQDGATRLLSVTEVAKELGVRYYRARGWMESGEIPSRNVGGYLKTTPAAVSSFREHLGKAA
jgi:hypothetical protein